MHLKNKKNSDNKHSNEIANGVANEIVIASHNQGKVKEISELLACFSTKISCSKDFNLSEPEENGKTFEENALIKAKYTSYQTKKIALADDSGLCVAILGGKPDINSARYAGKNKDFDQAMLNIQTEVSHNFNNIKDKNKLLQQSHKFYEFKEIGTADNPKAVFICSLCIYHPNGKYIITKGCVTGRLRFPPRGAKGFGYDPFFVPHNYDITFGEMTQEQKDKISHRTLAFEQLIKELNNCNFFNL